MQEYVIEVNGMEHTLQLSDEDAKARGLKSSDQAGAKSGSSKNKSRPASNKEG